MHETIRVIDGLEAVQRRPGMYFGNTHDGSAAVSMVLEVVGNVVDLHLARHARHVSVDLDADGFVTVEDDGPGVSTAAQENGRTLLEIVFTTLHAGATFDGHYPHVHVTAGLGGVGVAAVNALSARLEVESRHEGRLWRVSWERGRLVEPLASHGSSDRSGTRIRFLPDAQALPSWRVDRDRLEARLRELAWLNPSLEIRWCGATLPWHGGVAGLVRALVPRTPSGGTILEGHRLLDDVEVDFALAWSTHPDSEVRSFVNQNRSLKGTHVSGLHAALRGVAASLGAQAPDEELDARLRPGLVAAVHVLLRGPSFAGPTREHLLTPHAGTATERAVREAFAAVLPRRPDLEQHLRAMLALASTGK